MVESLEKYALSGFQLQTCLSLVSFPAKRYPASLPGHGVEKHIVCAGTRDCHVGVDIFRLEIGDEIEMSVRGCAAQIAQSEFRTHGFIVFTGHRQGLVVGIRQDYPPFTVGHRCLSAAGDTGLGYQVFESFPSFVMIKKSWHIVRHRSHKYHGCPSCCEIQGLAQGFHRHDPNPRNHEGVVDCPSGSHYRAVFAHGGLKQGIRDIVHIVHIRDY